MHKLILSITGLLMVGFGFGQTMVPIPVESHNAWIAETIEYKGDLFLQYRDLTGNYDLFRYNKDRGLSEIPSPSGFDGEGRGYLGEPFIFNEKLYLKYQGNDELYYLAEYDGEALSIIPNPDNVTQVRNGYDGKPVEYKGVLYMRYFFDGSPRFSLARLESGRIERISAEGFGTLYLGEYFVFQDMMYLNYFVSDNEVGLLAFDGESFISSIVSPEYPGTGTSGGLFYPFIFNDLVYLRLGVNSLGSTGLFEFDGSSITEIDFPFSYGTSCNCAGYLDNPFVFDSRLYIRAYNNGDLVLLELNNTLSEISGPNNDFYW